MVDLDSGFSRLLFPQAFSWLCTLVSFLVVLGGTGVLGIESGLATCKSGTLSSALSLAQVLDVLTDFNIYGQMSVCPGVQWSC